MKVGAFTKDENKIFILHQHLNRRLRTCKAELIRKNGYFVGKLRMKDEYRNGGIAFGNQKKTYKSFWFIALALLLIGIVAIWYHQ
jgi:hypothetical protein